MPLLISKQAGRLCYGAPCQILKSFNDEIYDSFGEAAEEVYEEVRAHSPLAKKIDDQFRAALREIGGWQKIAEVAFSNQRNRVLDI